MTKPRVLIVEDHQMTLVGLKLLLERDQAVEVVGEAEDGVKAIAKARELKPDVILMDIGLPEMDGIEATHVIKSESPTVRVIMLTSKDNEQDVMAALAAGADAYCMKGMDPANLSSIIQAVREGTAWLDPAVARLVLSRFQEQQYATALPVESMNLLKTTPSKPGADCPLTEREMEVLKLIVDGHSNPEIAEKLIITKATAKAHVHSILQKLCVDDRTQAAVLAMRQGLV